MWGYFGMHRYVGADCFPGADGSNLSRTIPIYGPNGNSLSEGSAGIRLIKNTTSGVFIGNISLIYSIKNPLCFLYTPNATPYDWYTNSQSYQNASLWSDVEKTNYDPCPHGWIVAKYATWGDFTITTAPFYIQGNKTSSGNNTATNGRLYNNIVWYPSTLYRRCLAGTLDYDSGYTSYYTATSLGMYPYVLSFTKTKILVESGRKGSGFPVRCIQE